jgi:ABC-type branched-subunit amino acid transport system ATPase component
MSLLEIVGLTKHFYRATALLDVTASVREGEILGLIGPNGSGKTTAFNCVSGLLRPDRGSIRFRGEQIGGLRPDAIFRKGVGRSFQLLQVFPRMTVLENMLLAAQQKSAGAFARILGCDSAAARRRAEDLLAVLGIDGLMEHLAGELSYGQQKLLDFGMVFMSEPSLVLLDEPMAAINPAMIEGLVNRIRQWNRAGVTFAVIEHNVGVILEFCHRVVVLDHGELIAEGEPAAIREHPQVIAAYFGS